MTGFQSIRVRVIKKITRISCGGLLVFILVFWDLFNVLELTEASLGIEREWDLIVVAKRQCHRVLTVWVEDMVEVEAWDVILDRHIPLWY